VLRYREVHGFWSVEELVEWCTDCGEVVWGGECLVAGYISVETSTVPTEAQ
jgi:hypothetical protein